MEIVICVVCLAKFEEVSEGTYCSWCNGAVCDNDERVPNVNDPQSYCKTCHNQDFWDVNYITNFGDVANATIGVPERTHPFAIRGYISNQIPMATRATSWTIVKRAHQEPI